MSIVRGRDSTIFRTVEFAGVSSCSRLVSVGENKVGSLNTGNRDVGSDDIKQAVDMREIIARVKLDLLS